MIQVRQRQIVNFKPKSIILLSGWKSKVNMYDLLEKFCSQCGRFDSRTFTPPEFNLPHIPGLTSQSWEEIYESWRLNNR